MPMRVNAINRILIRYKLQTRRTRRRRRPRRKIEPRRKSLIKF